MDKTNSIVIRPFYKRPQNISIVKTMSVAHIKSLGSEAVDVVPAVIEDAYHMLEVMMQVKHAFFDMPNLMTLGRYRYLLELYGTTYNLKCLAALDPFTDCTSEEQRAAMKYLDRDVYDNLHNTLVLCVAASAQSILNLPLTGKATSVVPLTDKHVTVNTAYGLLNIVFRLYEPTEVTSEAVREYYLRMIACNNPALSPRSMLLLQDAKFPLGLIPGISSRAVLESTAIASPIVDLSQL
jgi:hypothetical protein